MVRLCPVYAITDPGLLPGEHLFEKVEQALTAGIRTIQYRDKITNTHDKQRNATRLLKLCHKHGGQLIINDDVELTLNVGADGVHLGQSDMSLVHARQKLGEHCIIGITCHDQLKLAREAERQGADYVAFGRFYPSKTKPEASTAPLSLLENAQAELCVPIVAIGGISAENKRAVLAHGASSIAVCHSLFAAGNIANAAEKLLT